MVNGISPTLQDFSQLAQIGGQHGRIVDNQGGIAKTGVLGALRASSASNRATGEALLQFCEDNGFDLDELTPTQTRNLELGFKNSIREAAGNNELLTGSKLAEATRTGSLPGMQRAANAIIFDAPAMDEAIEAFVQAQNMTDAHAAECRDFLKMLLATELIPPLLPALWPGVFFNPPME